MNPSMPRQTFTSCTPIYFHLFQCLSLKGRDYILLEQKKRRNLQIFLPLKIFGIKKIVHNVGVPINLLNKLQLPIKIFHLKQVQCQKEHWKI
jgi:hypothetical protein